MTSQRAKRKNEHLSLAEKTYEAAHTIHPFDGVQIIPNALPELSVDEVDCSTTLAGQKVTWPFYFEAMTGGSDQAARVNAAFARVAQQANIPMATGSMSIILKETGSFPSFEIIRNENPSGFVMANISAKSNVEQAKKVVHLINANALEIHINAAQEIIMPEGDRSFKWLANIQKIVEHMTVPVIVKEVGFGMSKENIQQLTQHGVKYINVSGNGGTNFALIEGYRNHKQFIDMSNWGISTVQALLESRNSNIDVIASGGIVSPIDVIKAGILGAKATGVAGYFLHIYYQDGENGLLKEVQRWQTEIKGIMTILGCHHFNDLQKVPFVLSQDLLSYIQQRNISIK